MEQNQMSQRTVVLEAQEVAAGEVATEVLAIHHQLPHLKEVQEEVAVARLPITAVVVAVVLEE
jgi:hypothetical protein